MYLQHVWAVVFTSLCTDFPIPQRQPMEEQLEFENSPRSVFRRRHVTRPTRMMSASLANTCKNIMRVSSSAVTWLSQVPLRGFLVSQSIRCWRVTRTPRGGVALVAAGSCCLCWTVQNSSYLEVVVCALSSSVQSKLHRTPREIQRCGNLGSG